MRYSIPRSPLELGADYRGKDIRHASHGVNGGRGDALHLGY